MGFFNAFELLLSGHVLIAFPFLSGLFGIDECEGRYKSYNNGDDDDEEVSAASDYLVEKHRLVDLWSNVGVPGNPGNTRKLFLARWSGN
jgi:hypothetical protein